MFTPSDEITFGPGIDIETETLQTDIQRFIAIIGFCLMAIFALVQSMPITSDKKNVIEDLKREQKSQNQLLEQLQAENGTLKNELEAFREGEEQSEALARELQRAEKLLAEQAEQLNRLIAQRLEGQENLARFGRLLDERSREIERIDREKAVVEKRLAVAVEKAVEADVLHKEKKRLESFLKKILKPKTLPPEPIEKVRPKGTYVAFASSPAFLGLIESGKIHLYIMFEFIDKPFRVVSEHGKFNFPSQSLAEGLDFWRIGESQIPELVSKAFLKETTLASQKKTFIVGLPADISQSIRSRGEKGGRFIIENNGRVTWHEF